MKRVAIIGGGIAGFSCATALDSARFEVTVFDEARVPGGRMTTRKVGAARFDVGAPFFEVRSEEFRECVAAWGELNCAAPYSPSWSPDSLPSKAELWTGTPGMSAIARELGSLTELKWETKISRIQRAKTFTVHGRDGVVGEFDQVVVALPVAAARDLLVRSGQSVNALRPVRTARRWSVALEWSAQAGVEWSAGSWQGRVLDLAVKESSKPERESGERWTAYLSAASSAELTLGSDAAVAAVDELATLIQATGVAQMRAFRWDDGFVLAPFGASNVLIDELVLCGDWCTGATVEDAWSSGIAAARVIESRA